MMSRVRAGLTGLSLAVAAALAPAVLAQGAAPGAAQGSAGDPVVARVNGETILRSEVLAAYETLPPQFRAMPMEAIYPALVSQLIDRKLVVAEAKKDKIDQDEEFKRRMADLQERVMEQVYLTKKTDSQLTDAMLRQQYDKLPSETRVRASHILVKTRDEAVQIIRDIDRGAKFEEVAAKRSLDPSGRQGGDLGFFTREQMVGRFSEAAFRLKKGEMTKSPVQTEFGWHVIRVDDIQEDGKPPFEEVRGDLREQMADTVMSAEIDRLRAGAQIERFGMDGGPQ